MEYFVSARMGNVCWVMGVQVGVGVIVIQRSSGIPAQSMLIGDSFK